MREQGERMNECEWIYFIQWRLLYLVQLIIIKLMWAQCFHIFHFLKEFRNLDFLWLVQFLLCGKQFIFKVLYESALIEPTSLISFIEQRTEDYLEVRQRISSQRIQEGNKESSVIKTGNRECFIKIGMVRCLICYLRGLVRL